MKDLNFKKINDIAYAEEDIVAKELLEYLKPQYKNRLNNIKDRATDIVTNARNSLGIIKMNFPKLKIHKEKVGKNVFDWKIPEEWNIKFAFIKDKNNKTLVNFADNNLHVIGYSKPINVNLNKNQLLKKLHSLKNKPYAIPYITSYYKKKLGVLCH